MPPTTCSSGYLALMYRIMLSWYREFPCDESCWGAGHEDVVQ